MEVFELSRGWKIVIYIILGLFFALFTWLAVNCFIEPSLKRAIAFMLPMSLIAMFFIACGFLQVDEKVIFDDYSIRKESKLVNREILRNDVKDIGLIRTMCALSLMREKVNGYWLLLISRT
ncbi:hypothetical protein [Chitinophaga filiformis]|uniref:Uncharacterized protein n=1 Tax=Chitinophaga filiformis TaxID=104663 RepID=A0A1G8BG43_CHIFI|nr:hypothetical protein [Chitinophaga filiformis]SDH32216.1 hypothetical protein SAMN04488121_11135 [Chitinophaga filiformis]